jgi:rhodanese-related sulfurtransferase
MRLEITPQELQARLQAGEDVQLIDVREAMEFDYCHLPGSLLIPLGDLARRADEVREEGPVVLICHHGVRSGQALAFLRHRHGLSNLLNLRGGVHAWALQVDAGFPVY